MLLVAPLLALFGVFFFWPVAQMFLTSIHGYSRTTIVDYSVITLDHYARFLTDPFYVGILARTIWLAVIVTLICLVLAYPAAYHIARRPGRRQGIMLLVFLSPLLVSIVIRTYAWSLVLSSNGIINSLLAGLGLIQEPLNIMYTDVAVVIGLVHIYMAYMLLPIFTALASQDRALVMAAQNLGASPLRAFWYVTFPLSRPGVAAGAVLVFILSMSAFVTPTLLGGVWVKVLASMAYEQTVSFLNWPFGSAISVILLALTLMTVAVYQRVFRQDRSAALV